MEIVEETLSSGNMFSFYLQYPSKIRACYVSNAP